MKKTLALLLSTFLYASSVLQSQTLLNFYGDLYITSSVSYDGKLYHYEYVADSEVNGYDISNITIDLCDPNQLTSIYGDDSFKTVVEKETVKFDSIKPKGNDFVFGFYSEYAPVLNSAFIKASKETYTQTVYSPSCAIPETSTFAFGSLGMLFLLRRKR